MWGASEQLADERLITFGVDQPHLRLDFIDEAGLRNLMERAAEIELCSASVRRRVAD
jgi:hypothetical protein